MTRPRLFLLAALLAALPVALAQRGPSGPSPMDRYHEGARLFIDGQTEPAARAVDAGLAADPGNAKLQALRDLIRQQEEQDQKQNGQGQQQSPGEGDDQEPGDEGGQGDQSQPPPERPEDPSGAQQDQTRTQPQDNGQSPPQAPPPGEGGQTPTDAPGVPQGQMSRAQADRILDAVGGEEQLLLREMRRAPTRLRQSDKDW